MRSLSTCSRPVPPDPPELKFIQPATSYAKSPPYTFLQIFSTMGLNVLGKPYVPYQIVTRSLKRRWRYSVPSAFTNLAFIPRYLIAVVAATMLLSYSIISSVNTYSYFNFNAKPYSSEFPGHLSPYRRKLLYVKNPKSSSSTIAHILQRYTSREGLIVGYPNLTC